MKPTVYLAGPMTGVTWGEAIHWRNQVIVELSPTWTVLSPLKGQVDGNKLAADIIDASSYGDKDLPINWTATGITTQDEFYIDQSDFLLVNFLGAIKVSIGTIWEMGYAWSKQKKIVTVVEAGSIHDHPFVRRRSHVFVPTLEEALEFFKKVW